jgi:hypothetical protein
MVISEIKNRNASTILQNCSNCEIRKQVYYQIFQIPRSAELTEKYRFIGNSFGMLLQSVRMLNSSIIPVSVYYQVAAIYTPNYNLKTV